MSAATEPLDAATAQTLLDALHEAAVIVEADGHIAFENAAFTRSVRDGASGTHLGQLVDDPAAVERASLVWFGSGTARPASLAFAGTTHRCDGARLPGQPLALVRCVARTDAAAAFHDVSQAVDVEALERTKGRLRAALKEIETTNEALRASNHELDQFAAVVSHDLRTPLATISGMADLLRTDLEDPEHADIAGAIVRNARRMHEQISGILAVARAGHGDPPQQPLPLAQVIPSVRDLLSGRIHQTGAVIEIADELPAVMLHEAEAVQLLQNLLQNALTHAAPHADTPIIQVRAEPANGHVTISIEDNGPGVPAEQRTSVFGLFERGASENGGNGIGLAACRSIVGRRGGRIWIESSELGGAAVRFRLPRTPVAAGEPERSG